MNLNEIRYFLRNGPPASWLFYMALVLAESTTIAAVVPGDSVFNNPLLGTAFLCSLAWQVVLSGCAVLHKMVSPKISHCYNTLKILLYTFAVRKSGGGEETAAIVFLTIYSVYDTYIYAAQRWRFPSLRALLTITQPIFDLAVQTTPLNRGVEAGAVVQMTDTTQPTIRHQEKRCVICLEEYCNEAANARLECNHTFHRRCIREWLAIKNTCPTCRFGEVSENGMNV